MGFTQRLKLEGETKNMCVWTKKRGSMNAVVLMATPCPKSLHGKGEKWIARNILQGLDSRQPMTAREKVGFTKNTARLR